MPKSDRPYWAGLSSIDGVGPNSLPLFGFPVLVELERVLFADKELLIQAGLPTNVAIRIVGFPGRNDINKWFYRALNPERILNYHF